LAEQQASEARTSSDEQGRGMRRVAIVICNQEEQVIGKADDGGRRRNRDGPSDAGKKVKNDKEGRPVGQLK
jgi:hypothetical protein